MATSRDFNAMLNEYLTYDLLKGEYIKRDFILNKCKKDTSWKGGDLIYPFTGGTPTSIKYGGLVADSDISKHTYVRGKLSGYKEAWGTLAWHSRDLYEHDGRVKEDSFLKNLPGQVEDLMENFKQVVSVNLLNGAHFAKVTADTTANDGILDVDHPERFEIGQKVITGAYTGYVAPSGGINVNTKKVKLVTARGGATAVDFSSGAGISDGDKLYYEGQSSSAFSNLKDAIFSNSNGGSDSYLGKTKADYKFLQSTEISGATWNAANVFDKMLDAQITHNNLGRKGKGEWVVSYKNWGVMSKLLESGSGSYKHTDTKASIYGWDTITITGPKGVITVNAVHELDDDIFYMCDFGKVTFHTNKYFRKHTDMNGNQYYTVRNTDGYVYICDISLYGDMVVEPWCQMGVHSVPDLAA